MPVSDLGGSRLSIKSRLDRPSDSWTLDNVDPLRFINARASDRVNLRVGYLEPVTLIPSRVGWIKNGRIRQYRLDLACNPDGTTSETCSLQGFDGIVAMLKQTVQKRYLHFPKKEVVSATPEATAIPETVGQFSAQDIARDLLTLVQGETYTLTWGCRDYQLLVDYNVTGRPIDRIADLVEPWSLVDPFAVDIYIEGRNINVQARKDVPEADYTFTLPDARLDRIGVVKQQLPVFGRVTLFGRLQSTSLVDDPDQPGSDLEGGGAVSVGLSPSEKTEKSTSERNADPSDPKSKSKDFGRVETESVYRMPDKLLLRQRKKTYAGIPAILISDEQLFNDWEDSQYDESGPINNPVCRGQTVIVEGYPNGDTRRTWQEIRAEETQYSYDTLKFLESQITMKKIINTRTNALEPSEQTIKKYTDAANLQVEESTTVLKRRKRNTTSAVWYVAQRDSKISGGHRPGGPGRGLFFGKQTLDPDDPNAPADDGQMQPISLTEVITADDPEAEPFEYRNENLTAADLAFIMDQLRRASGLWAYELTFTCPIMAWIKRGAIVQFNNVHTKAGLDINLRPALVIDVQLDQDEGNDAPTGSATITAMFWAAN